MDSEVGQGLETKEEDLREELKKTKIEEEVYGLEPEEAINLPSKSRKELLEERLLTIILKYPQNLTLVEENKISCFSSELQEILINLKKDSDFSPEKLSVRALDLFNLNSLKAEIEEMEEKDISSEIQFCLKEIQCTEVKNQLEKISHEIKIAEEKKDFKKIEELAQKFNVLTKEIL